MGASTADLRALVEGHEPASPRESDAKARFLAELERLAAPCDDWELHAKAAEQHGVAIRNPAARSVPFVKIAQLHPQHRCLKPI